MIKLFASSREVNIVEIPACIGKGMTEKTEKLVCSVLFRFLFFIHKIVARPGNWDPTERTLGKSQVR